MLKYLLCRISLGYAGLDCTNEDSKVYEARGMRGKRFKQAVLGIFFFSKKRDFLNNQYWKCR